MLVFPQWRPDVVSDGCRIQRWMPAERFAPYVARPVVLPPPPPQIEDEDSSGSSSPERTTSDIGVEGGEITICGWRGCGAQFPGVARLSAHVARTHAHAHRDGLFYCGWKGCARPQRGFNARYKMLVHVRTHTNERPHVCTQCNKSFSRAENLKIHLRSHSGEKPYVCPYEGCGKAYSNSSDRFKHTRTHTVDKPYYCKVPGCNKRYTDPSSLRKHVKTYKHFTPKEPVRNESSDEVKSAEFSPPRENISSYPSIEPTSPMRVTPYSPPQNTMPPTIPPYNPILPLTDAPTTLAYRPILDAVTYIRPLESIYPIRVPSHEMSYLEYTKMYEHAYRSYYSNTIYPVLRPTVNEKVFTYEEQTRVHDVTMEEVRRKTPERYSPKVKEVRYNATHEELPLNLKCVKRFDCKSIEKLIKRTDLPLDLSTKT